MVAEVRTMKLEVSPLQLAEWLIHGIAVVIWLWQVDSANDLTARPIPTATTLWEVVRSTSRGEGLQADMQLCTPNSVVPARDLIA
jgi:hypothetical protein